MNTVYITIENDRWDLIAMRAYGDCKQEQIRKLQAANPYVQHTLVFKAGVKIIVPIDETEQAKVIQKPWQKLQPTTNAAELLTGFTNG